MAGGLGVITDNAGCSGGTPHTFQHVENLKPIDDQING
jgi:hypothetical protein